MPPRKLSESDKKEILDRYRNQLEETTATIASSYGVSPSTISRILKQNLPNEEYEALIHQKRSGALRSPAEIEVLPETPAEISSQIADLPMSTATSSVLDKVPSPRRRRKRSTELESPLETQLELATVATEVNHALEQGSEFDTLQPDTETLTLVEAGITPLEDDLEGEDLDEELEDEDLEDEDLEDLDEDFDEDEEDFTGEADALHSVQIQSSGKLKILPLSEATIPKICYIVIDRSSDLITRPLKDFAELGQVPTEEIQEKTLPIFDNHRVAKRFMRRMQRIVKIPDGRMFQKVRPYLQAKGITRLLIDGHVYSL
jgi:hypothetical protein